MSLFAGCSCCSIVPPYMLDKLARHDDPEVRARAAATIQSLRHAHGLNAATASMMRVAVAATPASVRKVRRVFDCQGTSDLSLKLVMSEGDPVPADIAVQEAYDHAGITWDFFQTLFKRNSCDDRGMTLISSVHYSENGQGYDNALWNRQQMIYGDGGTIFGRMTQCLDVVAHELTHGVTQYSAGLPYANQSGALNEHFSDVFGVVVRQWHGNEADLAKANWLVGDKLMLNGEALRSMKAPGSANGDDPQPADMSTYKTLPNTYEGDYGGVHINSGIPNKAFYLAAMAIGKPSWEDAATIWYKTLTQRLNGETSFEKCALETISVARDFFDDATAAKVTEAWKAVGVITANIGPIASLSPASLQQAATLQAVDLPPSVPPADIIAIAAPPAKTARSSHKRSKPKKQAATTGKPPVLENTR